MGVEGLLDRFHATEFAVPSHHTLHSGITGRGRPREEGYLIKVLNGITPIDEFNRGDNAGSAYFHVNRQGSTIAMSADNGTMSEGPYVYDAFGNGAAATGITFTSAAAGDSVTLKAWQGIAYITATRGTITLA